jgi:hypothetical protein
MMVHASDGNGGADVAAGNVTFVFPVSGQQFPVSQAMLKGMVTSPYAEFSGLSVALLVTGDYHVVYEGEVIIFSSLSFRMLTDVTDDGASLNSPTT